MFSNLLLAALTLCAVSYDAARAAPSTSPSPRPLVVWHGMGDSYASPGMVEFQETVERLHPGIFVHRIFLNEDAEEDKKATYIGNINEQVANVSAQLFSIPELRHGFDAIGFSQGGQFLRAYVEKYNDPPVNNLITFGAQHMGISDIPPCKRFDLVCELARRAAQRGVYQEWAQASLVQAQYFRDPDRLDEYLNVNQFLTSINNEVSSSLNSTYAHNIESLNKFVLVLFSEDQTVVPKESSWFGSWAPSEDGVAEKTIIPMRLQPLYLENRIGIRTLDERGDLVMWPCKGQHMELSNACWRPLVRRYIGGDLNVVDEQEASAVLMVQS